VSELLPLLYLHGLSGNDFAPALEQFLGTSAGLSAATVTRLTTQWQEEARAFQARDLREVDYVYCWADGVHVNVRLDEERLCLLVLTGVRADGRKELITLADGYRESEGSWADLLRDAKRRGMRAPVLAVGDGALGFWAALGSWWLIRDTSARVLGLGCDLGHDLACGRSFALVPAAESGMSCRCILPPGQSPIRRSRRRSGRCTGPGGRRARWRC
jgi:hypothetical protein